MRTWGRGSLSGIVASFTPGVGRLLGPETTVMALKATVCKARLNIADMDRGYYHEHGLTLAQHPSETDERLMVRLLAFALNAHGELTFTKGLSTDDEPELWRRGWADEIPLWIELGLPDESRIRKACNRADQVRIYAYGGRPAAVWRREMGNSFSRFSNLEVFELPRDATQAIADMAGKSMTLQCTVQDGQVGLGDERDHVLLEPTRLYPL